ncbi:MAG: hypothetical protein FGM39_10415 [Phycisphaerales bacterium]|nr:hypothetical protein [Phycisphaerales bacterium]
MANEEIVAAAGVLTTDDWVHIKSLIRDEVTIALADVVTAKQLEAAIAVALERQAERTAIQMERYDLYLRQAETNMSAARVEMKTATDEIREMGRRFDDLARGLAAKQAALEESDRGRSEQVHALAGTVAAIGLREDKLSDNMTRQTAEMRRISVALFGDKHEDGPESLFRMVTGLSEQVGAVALRVTGIDEQMRLREARWAFVRAGASAAWGALRGSVGKWLLLAAGGSALGGVVYRILELIGAMK